MRLKTAVCVVLTACVLHYNRHRVAMIIIWYLVMANMPTPSSIPQSDPIPSKDLLKGRALQCLEKNLVKGPGYYTHSPCLHKYGPFQWLWDTCFHVIVMAKSEKQSDGQPPPGLRDFHTLFQHQHPNGFIPEVVFWGEKPWMHRVVDSLWGYSTQSETDITQMPMLPYALRALIRSAVSQNDAQQILQHYGSKVMRNLEWWSEARDPDGNGLVSIVHPWESGMDASPLYDEVFLGIEGTQSEVTPWRLYPHYHMLLYQYRHLANWDLAKMLSLPGSFDVEDVAVNSVLSAGWDVMADLYETFVVKEDQEEMALYCRTRAKTIREAVERLMWDSHHQQYLSYYYTKQFPNSERKPLTARVIHTLFPLLMRSLNSERVAAIKDSLENPHDFGTPFMVPTVSLNSTQFLPGASTLMWRGPVWPNANWFIVEGLDVQGLRDLKEQILQKWLKMTLDHGYFEYHHPFSGMGLGQHCLGMSAAIVDWL